MSQPTAPGQPNQPPQGGRPPLPPQQGGQPPQYQQGGQPQYQQPAPQYQPAAPQYPPQGYQPQQQYPQQGYQPQQGYSQQQPGYAPQGYPQPQGYAPQAFPPAGGQRPPTGKSSSKLIMIVIAAVAVLAIIGGVFLAMSGKPKTPDPDVTPGPVPTTTAPTPPPTQSPTPDPSTPAPDPTTAPPSPQPPPSDGIAIGGGVLLTVPSGWEVTQQIPTGVVVTNGDAVFVAETVQGKPGMDPAQLCTSYQQDVLKDASNVKHGDPRSQDVGTDLLSVVDCTSGYTQTQGGKTVQLFAQTFVSVRASDGLVLFATVHYHEKTSDATISQVNGMLGGLVGSQAAGG
ncbi:MAG: hypothetical protein QM804_08170 [Propionicimonas sp.]